MAGSHEQEQQHGERAAEPEVEAPAERDPVHLQRDHVRVVLGRLGREDQHQVEDLQYIDHQGHQDDRQHRPQQRDGDPAEDLPLRGAVDPGRLEDSRGRAASPAAISTMAKPAQIQT